MKFGVQYQTLGHRIDIGRLNKAQTKFLDGKEDHTMPAIWAAALYVLVEGGDAEITNDFGKTLRITVEDLSPPEPRK